MATLPPTARKLPHFDLGFLSGNWYPEAARKRQLAGRVLVEFEIGEDGHPNVLQVAQAEADPLLQSAALGAVRSMHFRLPDSDYNPQDRTPFGMSVLFCFLKCGGSGLAPFEGYEKNQIVITGGH